MAARGQAMARVFAKGGSTEDLTLAEAATESTEGFLEAAQEHTLFQGDVVVAVAVEDVDLKSLAQNSLKDPMILLGAESRVEPLSLQIQF